MWICFRRRANFDYDCTVILKTNTVRAANAHAIKEIASNAAAKVDSAKFGDEFGDLFSVVGAKAVQLDKRRVPSCNFFSDDLDGVVDGSYHAVLSPHSLDYVAIDDFERQKVSPWNQQASLDSCLSRRSDWTDFASPRSNASFNRWFNSAS